MAVVVGFLSMMLILLRVTGLIRPYNVPTDAMRPAVAAGDHVLVEGFSHKIRGPRRGDIAVFTTKAIPRNPPGTRYLKRIVGEPGEQLQIVNGKLLVNGKHVALTNEQGEIHYSSPRGASFLASSNDTVTVPPGQYFVLGDNTANSMDSRYFGFVAAEEIKGRCVFCYWPLRRFGSHP
jgi:signal peptidase I